MVPIIGETVEWRGRMFDVVNRQCSGYAGWLLTLRSRDDGHEVQALASQCTRVSGPMIDNVIPMPRKPAHLYLATVNGEAVS